MVAETDTSGTQAVFPYNTNPRPNIINGNDKL